MGTDLAEIDADGQRWSTWTQQRPAARGPHFDNAAAGRSSAAVLQATSDHALIEASVGAYVAEELAAPVLSAGRAALAGLLGVEADGLAFVESGSAARAALLEAWPLAVGDTVAVVPGEWGPNLEAFGGRGLQIVAGYRPAVVGQARGQRAGDEPARRTGRRAAGVARGTCGWSRRTESRGAGAP